MPTNPIHTTTGLLHNKIVFGRRTQILSDWFARMIPPNGRVLDVGCGDGLISSLLQAKRPDLSIHGIDVLVRPGAHIPVTSFDGLRIPFPDNSFEVALFSDVLHHTEDPTVLLREARRVAGCLVIKDHNRDGIAAQQRLRFMDWIGNARFGVALPYNYWPSRRWKQAWQEVGLQTDQMVVDVGLYPPPLGWIFGARLHFVAALSRCAPHS
jgi:SAM-dependent methyltransferase